MPLFGPKANTNPFDRFFFNFNKTCILGKNECTYIYFEQSNIFKIRIKDANLHN